jgi:hypothetical protein
VIVRQLEPGTRQRIGIGEPVADNDDVLLMVFGRELRRNP